MKLYIDPTPNESGAYPNPKCQPFKGCIPLDDEQSATFLQYNGFVTIVSAEEEYEEGFFRTVYEVEPDLEAWEEWKASLPPEPEPEPAPEYVTYGELAAAIREGVNSVE